MMKQTEQKIEAVNDFRKENENGLVFSYLTLRRLIGLGGMSLPVILAIFPSRVTDYYGIEPSISDYFYTNKGDILVVILCVLGAFLTTYKGYTVTERILTFISGLSGIGVAFVPTKQTCGNCILSVHTNSGGIFPHLAGTAWHFAFAAVFLTSLAIISLVFFTKSNVRIHVKDNGKKTQKGKRNMVYRISGWLIIFSLAIIGLFFIIKPDVHHFPVVFTFESVAVEAFGFSWLVKGGSLWADIAGQP